MNDQTRISSSSPFTQPRFFVAPRLDERLTALLTENSVQKRNKPKRKLTMTRYAAYLRISSEEQIGNYSIDAQRRAVQTWVEARDGQLVKVYIDEAQSGRTADRPGFLEMRQDARKRAFDALVVHKFDRFARNRTDALAIKSLLRYDYGIKVFSATEPSEDSDGPIGALIEGIMESVAEWYSRNLATEVAKGRREKSRQGYHNNAVPFGLKRVGKEVVPNPDELPGLLMAFEAYASNKYGYVGIARLLNEQGYHSTSGRKFTKDTVREILRNRIYIGKIRYQETKHNSEGRRVFTEPIQWFEGQHEPVIPKDLFEKCQNIRVLRDSHKQAPKTFVPYLLRGMVYCKYCCSHPLPNADFPSWGKMYCQRNGNRLYYRCGAKFAGHDCPQIGARQDAIDAEVLEVLTTLKPPADWKSRILTTVGEILGELSLEQRIAEIRQTIERMDFRWDNGFITDKADYLEKRVKLQQELEKLTPVREELDVAVDILENFADHFKQCGDDVERQHELVKLIVDRIYIDRGHVVEVTLKADYHVILGQNAKEPTSIEIDPHVSEWALRDSNP
ncbi:MAG: recombinase family protein [Anaerolineae bacterium]|nr:recombinase family protein [Anaerolineae bacterium]